MIDLKALRAELDEMRKARIEAEQTGGDLEALISDMRREGLGFRFDPNAERPARTRH
ncbi:MAG: hypothetical protein AB7K35_16225 [Pseudorhodoplanes sp.]